MKLFGLNLNPYVLGALVLVTLLGLFKFSLVYFGIGLGWANGAVLLQRHQSTDKTKLWIVAVLNLLFPLIAIYAAYVREKESVLPKTSV